VEGWLLPGLTGLKVRCVVDSNMAVLDAPALAGAPPPPMAAEMFGAFRAF
jgi:hypothetical protein